MIMDVLAPWTGLSLMALSATGKVVGVSLNGSHEPGHLEEMQENADNCPNPRFRKILQLLVAVERGSDVFSKFPDVDRLVEVRILSVDTAVRGRGIAKALLEKSRSAKGKVYLNLLPSCKPLSLAYSLFFPVLYSFLFLVPFF
jgi:predicted GNAT family acetyltransferase